MATEIPMLCLQLPTSWRYPDLT